MGAIAGLSSAEVGLEGKIIGIRDDRVKRLESIPGIGKLSSPALLGAQSVAMAAMRYGGFFYNVPTQLPE